MNDELVYKILGLIQHATGTITITDYTQLALKTVTVNANVLTEGTNFNRGASNNACATALAAAIDALANVNATAVGNVITIKADAIGTAANAYNLLTNATAGITLSGATLLGGVAATYTPSIQFTGSFNPIQVDSVIKIANLSASGTVTITPQVSVDNSNWIDRTASSALNANGTSELHTTEPLPFWRLKIVLGGTSPSADLELESRKSN